MRQMTTVVATDSCCRVDYVHVLTMDSAMSGAQLCQYSSLIIGSVCSAVAMGDGRPLSSFDELLSMSVQTASWWIVLMVDL